MAVIAIELVEKMRRRLFFERAKTRRQAKSVVAKLLTVGAKLLTHQTPAKETSVTCV